MFSNVRWYFYVLSLVTVSFRLLPRMASTLFDGSDITKCLHPNGEYLCNVDARLLACPIVKDQNPREYKITQAVPLHLIAQLRTQQGPVPLTSITPLLLFFFFKSCETSSYTPINKPMNITIRCRGPPPPASCHTTLTPNSLVDPGHQKPPFTLTVQARDTIALLKYQIYEEESIPIHEQRIVPNIAGEAPPDDHRRLQACGIQSGDVITMYRIPKPLPNFGINEPFKISMSRYHCLVRFFP